MFKGDESTAKSMWTHDTGLTWVHAQNLTINRISLDVIIITTIITNESNLLITKKNR